MNASAIGVSKLCCPVCWDLLDVIRRDVPVPMGALQDHFSVRGFHKTVYYEALPPGIPQEVHDKMVSRFQAYLRNQLGQLVQPTTWVKTHHSTQSSSGASVASSVTPQGKGRDVFASNNSDDNSDNGGDNSGDNSGDGGNSGDNNGDDGDNSWPA